MKDEIGELENLAQGNPSSILDEFLVKQPEEFQLAVRRTIQTFKISPEDPYFLILVQLKLTHLFIQSTPERIDKSFDSGLKLVEKNLENILDKISDVALKQSTGKLNSAIAKILEDNNISHNKRRFSPRVTATIITSAGMCLSLFAGLIGGVAIKDSPQYSAWKQKLSTEELNLLEWGKSREGELARNLLLWNDDLENKGCKKKASDLGISFTIGSQEMVEGFCVLNVEPESQRKYRDRE